MLGTQDRQTYLNAVRLPDGFQFDCAAGTTYSLDLMALLILPLSFVRFEADSAGEALRDPLSLLEALRRCAERIVLFCQQGRISVPASQHLLFSYLDPMVVEARAHHPQGAFHPKTWLLRFVRPEDKAVRYRFLCLSRNLTFTHSWDVIFSIEGELTQRQRGFWRMKPLGDFFQSLADLAVQPLAKDKSQILDRIQHEIRRTKFYLAPPFEDEALRFWPLGIPGYFSSPLRGRRDQVMVVSPFLSDPFLDSIADEGSNHVLISRSDSLEDMRPQTLAGFEKVFVVDDAATDVSSAPAGVDSSTENGTASVAESTEDGSESPETLDSSDVRESAQPTIQEQAEADLSGLHAKLYVAKAGWKSRIWIGSANATTAAMPRPGGIGGRDWGRNVEFMVELQGSWSRFGIPAFLGDESTSGHFGELLIPYQPGDPPDEEDRSRKEGLL